MSRKTSKFGLILTKEFLQEQYYVNKKSQKEIANQVGCDQFVVYYYMKKYNMQARSVTENFEIGKHPMLGKENKWGKHTQEYKLHMSKLNTGTNNKMYGKKLSEEQKQKLREQFSGERNPMFGKRGPLAPGYKHTKDKTGTLPKQIRSMVQCKEWTRYCMVRDSFTCQACGDSRGGNLQVHHCKTVLTIIKENNISSTQEAAEIAELWDINNGITLCINCHIEIHRRHK